MDKILEKLPELHRTMVRHTLDAITNEKDRETRRVFGAWLKGQADILLADGLIEVDDYLLMVRTK